MLVYFSNLLSDHPRSHPAGDIGSGITYWELSQTTRNSFVQRLAFLQAAPWRQWHIVIPYACLKFKSLQMAPSSFVAPIWPAEAGLSHNHKRV